MKTPSTAWPSLNALILSLLATVTPSLCSTRSLCSWNGNQRCRVSSRSPANTNHRACAKERYPHTSYRCLLTHHHCLPFPLPRLGGGRRGREQCRVGVHGQPAQCDILAPRAEYAHVIVSLCVCESINTLYIHYTHTYRSRAPFIYGEAMTKARESRLLHRRCYTHIQTPSLW